MSPNKEGSKDGSNESVALLYDHFILGTLHQRVGEQEQLMRRSTVSSDPFINGGWIRIINQSGNFTNYSSKHGHSSGAELGIRINL